MRSALQLVALGALFLACPPNAETKRIHSYAGPYIIYAERFYLCEQKYKWDWNVKITHFNPAKPNEVQRLTGKINFTQSGIAEDNWINVYLDVRSNNMWKENAFVMKFPRGACGDLRRNIPHFYYTFFNKSDNYPCNIVQDVYEVEDAPVRWVFPSVPVLPYGQYRFRMLSGKIKDPKTLVGCFMVNGVVVPKT